MHHASATWACRKWGACASLRRATRRPSGRGAGQHHIKHPARASIGDVQRSCEGWPAGPLWHEAVSRRLRSSMMRERSSANSGRPCPSPPTLLETRLQMHLQRGHMAQSQLIHHFVHQPGQLGEFACQRCVVASPPWPASRTGLATAAPAVLEACLHAAKRRAARLASESRARLPVPPPPPHLR